MQLQNPRSGNILIISAVSMTVLIGMIGLGVELSQGWMVKKEVQKALDAGTKAGAFYLDGTAAGVTAAQNAAVSYCNQNFANGEALTVAPGDVEFGVWDNTAHTFTSESDPNLINALRIDHQVSVGTGFAAAVFGTAAINPAARSIGSILPIGAGAADCYLPIAIPGCELQKILDQGNALEDQPFIFSGGATDTAAWVGPGGTPNASYLGEQIEGWASGGTCDDGDDIIETGMSVGLNNGMIDNLLTKMADSIEASDTTWDSAVWGSLPGQHTHSLIDPTYYGKTLEGPIIVLAGDQYCSGTPFSGTSTVQAFIKGAVYEVSKQGSNKQIVMRLDTTSYDDEGIIGGDPNATNWGIVDWVTSNPFI